MKNNLLKKLAIAFMLLVTVLSIIGNDSSPKLATTSISEESDGSGNSYTGLISIQSDNVDSAAYDATTRIMTVRFDNGALYEYYGVPNKLWTAFINAQPHPWSQVGYPRLIQGGYQYKRIQ